MSEVSNQFPTQLELRRRPEPRPLFAPLLPAFHGLLARSSVLKSWHSTNLGPEPHLLTRNRFHSSQDAIDLKRKSRTGSFSTSYLTMTVPNLVRPAPRGREDSRSHRSTRTNRQTVQLRDGFALNSLRTCGVNQGLLQIDDWSSRLCSNSATLLEFESVQIPDRYKS